MCSTTRDGPFFWAWTSTGYTPSLREGGEIERDKTETYLQYFVMYHFGKAVPSDEHAQQQEYDTGDGERCRRTHGRCGSSRAGSHLDTISRSPKMRRSANGRRSRRSLKVGGWRNGCSSRLREKIALVTRSICIYRHLALRIAWNDKSFTAGCTIRTTWSGVFVVSVRVSVCAYVSVCVCVSECRWVCMNVVG